jgi:hypothetical protein
MRINLWGAICALVTLGLGFSASARAEEFASTAELIGRLEAAEAQINRLESAIANNNGGGCGCNDSCCDSCCDQSGWYGGAELVALKVHQTEGLHDDADYQVGTRLWLGAQRSDGLGLRLRWFDYTQLIEADEDLVDIENIDLELTDAFVLGHWSGLVSGGVRYTDYHEIVDDGNTETNISATGLTFGLQANRALRGRLSLFAALQESIMFGDDRENDADNITFSITEMQLGLQVDRCLDNGGVMFARTGVEGQYYSGSSDFDSEGLGLFGFFLTVGVMR